MPNHVFHAIFLCSFGILVVFGLILGFPSLSLVSSSQFPSKTVDLVGFGRIRSHELSRGSGVSNISNLQSPESGDLEFHIFS